MKAMIIAASLAAGAAAAPQFAFAQADTAKSTPKFTVTGNAALVSDYRFRGIAQTFKVPAIQGGFDYSHNVGFYFGNWNSNVNTGAGYPGGSIEMDLYGGWKRTWDDWGLDLGTIYYLYPATEARVGNFPANPRNGEIHNGYVNNWELYAGASVKWVTLKFYYAVSDYFSLPDTEGSNYLDLSASYSELGNGWGVVGHVGSFRLQNWHINTDLTDANYVDWKLGVTKNVRGWVLGAAYVDTNAEGSCDQDNLGFYCFGDSASGATNFTNAAGGTVVVSVLKTF